MSRSCSACRRSACSRSRPSTPCSISSRSAPFHVQLCGTTPCLLRGADELIELCHQRIGEQHRVTADGKLSWIEVECLGACVNAPMAQINYDYYEDLTPESFSRILDDLVAGKKVKPGPQVDRQLSAPIGAPTTLTDPALYARKVNGGAGPPGASPMSRPSGRHRRRMCAKRRLRSRRSRSRGQRKACRPRSRLRKRRRKAGAIGRHARR